MEAGRVAEWEDDGAVDMFGHLFDDLFGEGFWFCGCADQDMGFDFLDHRE